MDDLDVRFDLNPSGLSAEISEGGPVERDGPEWDPLRLELRDLDARELFAWIRGLRGSSHAGLGVLERRGFGSPHGAEPPLAERFRGAEFTIWFSNRLEGALAERDGEGISTGARVVELPVWAVWELWGLVSSARAFVEGRASVHRWAAWPDGRAPLSDERSRIREVDAGWVERVELAVRQALGV